ncbi:hypothetical protein SCHPADRAFT_517758 [Schizopora paradoxa]|uniref:Uncharacterized protein n=1 Tax=Schizopora paradoxa TaxID=27342 RepID=A0A0H2RFW5_9AGAM|nr:hypothetical protein SCHPADRAFT_517758 [Schizopora paradoxa]
MGLYENSGLMAFSTLHIAIRSCRAAPILTSNTILLPISLSLIRREDPDGQIRSISRTRTKQRLHRLLFVLLYHAGREDLVEGNAKTRLRMREWRTEHLERDTRVSTRLLVISRVATHANLSKSDLFLTWIR